MVLDQGFTGKNDLPMVLVYFPTVDDDSLYEVEVYKPGLA